MKVVKPIVFKNYGFSRATPATYYDNTGTLVTAGIDVLRLGYNPDTLEFLGPIIEGEATNLISRSIDFTDALWNKSGFFAISTDGAETNPDGTIGAQYTSGSDDFGFMMYELPEVVTEAVYSFSIYVKVQTPALPENTTALALQLYTASGDPVINSSVFNLFNETALEPEAQIQKLPNGWFRISLYAPVAPADIGTGFYARLLLLNESRFYVFGAQTEIIDLAASENPTSFIYTTSSTETRAPDLQSSPPSLVISNVDENDHPDWDDEVTYVAGQQVIVRGDNHRVYEALGGSTDSFPPDNPEDWLDQGATNRWRMWDMAVGSEKQTVGNSSDGSVEVLVDLSQPVNSVVLLNMDGVDVEVTMRDSGGNEVYTHYKILMLPSPADWWSYFFAPRRRAKMLVLTDLPPVRPSTIEMTLKGGSDDARIGKMIVGQGFDIGCARYGTSVGILDFSRKERDPFGNNFVLERRYIDRAEFDIQVPTPRVDEVKELLAELRATPVVYVGKETFQSTVIFGFFRDFSIILSGPKQSDCSMEVEGI